MARTLHKLSALAVRALDRPGRHSDGGGLYLHITDDGRSVRRRWIFRYSRFGRTRELGLGSGRDLSLANARVEASKLREALEQGLDPKDERESSKQGPTLFGTYADQYIAAQRPSWRNEKHAQQWEMTITKYAASLRRMPLDEISTADILTVLKPRWSKTPETAKRLQSRIEAILDAAKANGLRTGDNPARWRGHLDQLLPKRTKLSRGHHAALPFAELPLFMAELAARDALAARAFEFLILTAARTGDVIGATWNEIDIDNAIWSIPAERMKVAKEHRVPLSDKAVQILRDIGPKEQGPIFMGSSGKPLSSMALLMLLRRMQRSDLTAHGFRSTFKDWAMELTGFPSEMSEMALAHTIGNKVEAAYRRGDLFDKRRAMMDAWSNFSNGQSEVIQLAVLKTGT